MARKPKQRAERSPLGDLVDIASVSPDGLVITPAGRYVRTLEITRVPNQFAATDEERRRIYDLQRRLAASIPDGHEIVWHVLRQPLPPELVSEPDRLAARRAAQADLELDGNRDLAKARLRLQRLTATTVGAAAEGDIGASWTRHFVQVVWRPQPVQLADRLRGEASKQRGDARELRYEDHYVAANGSLDLMDRVAGRLADIRAIARPLDGAECLALAWERLHPAAGPYPFPEQFAALCHSLPADNPEDAAADRAAIVEALCAGLADYEEIVPRAEIRVDGRHLRHADGTAEEMLYLSRQPNQVDPWWLDGLSQTPLASSLVVRLSPKSRSTTRVATRASVARAHAAAENASRLTLEDRKVIGEKEEVEAQLASEAGATIFRAAVYVSLRSIDGSTDALDAYASALVSEYRSHRDAGLMRGGRLGARGWRATLTTGHDPLARTTDWAPSDVPYLIPLSSSRCGHDRGIPLGFAWPHRTLDRLDLFAPDAGTSILGITGMGGHGKTLSANVVAARCVARGMTLRIIDRSTAENAADGSRTGGHYDALLSLIPGSHRISIGTDDPRSARLNPWDNAHDAGNVPESQISFLVSLHDLLIGEAQQGSTVDRRLDPTDRALITNAITAVYEEADATRASRNPVRPNESALAEVLMREMAEAEEDTLLRPRYAALLERLRPFYGDGRQAFLLDSISDVPLDAPAIVFDTTGVPKERLPAVQLIILQAITAEAERLKQRRDALQLEGTPAPEWWGRVLVGIEEVWHIAATQAGADMLSEWARRGRHLKMVLLWVTQFLSDLESLGGQVLLKQTAATITHHQDSSGLVTASKDGSSALTDAAHAAGLTVDDVAMIGSLTTRRGEYAEAFIRTSKGRGLMRMAYAAPEFWALAQDPDDQQPLRALALRETGNDPWHAVGLLADPQWRRRAAASI